MKIAHESGFKAVQRAGTLNFVSLKSAWEYVFAERIYFRASGESEGEGKKSFTKAPSTTTRIFLKFTMIKQQNHLMTASFGSGFYFYHGTEHSRLDCFCLRFYCLFLLFHPIQFISHFIWARIEQTKGFHPHRLYQHTICLFFRSLVHKWNFSRFHLAAQNDHFNPLISSAFLFVSFILIFIFLTHEFPLFSTR